MTSFEPHRSSPNEDAAQMTALDANSDDVIGVVAVGGKPEGVHVRRDGKEVWVTSESDNAVFVIETATPRLLQQIPVGPRPRSIVFRTDSSRAYVPCENGVSVSLIDTATRKVARDRGALSSSNNSARAPQ